MYVCHQYFFVSLSKISHFAETHNTKTFLNVGFYLCVSIISFLIIYSIFRKITDIRSKKISLYNSRSTWRTTWIIGGLLSLLSYLLNLHILYINWYFIIVGIIPLINSFFKYSEITNEHLILYYGIFFKRKLLKFKWSEILDIGYKTVKKNSKVSAGGRVWITASDEYDTDVLAIQFKESIPIEIAKHLKKSNKFNLLVSEYKINDEGTEVILKTEPEGGFDNFLYSISKYSKFGAGFEKLQSGFAFYFFEIIGILLFFIVAIMPLFMFFIILSSQ